MQRQIHKLRTKHQHFHDPYRCHLELESNCNNTIRTRRPSYGEQRFQQNTREEPSGQQYKRDWSGPWLNFADEEEEMREKLIA